MKHVGIVCHTKMATGPDKVIYNRVEDRLITLLEKNTMIPVLIPIASLENLGDYFHRLDGLIFAGTTDVAPFYYGEEPTDKTGQLDLELDQFEMTLLKQAIGRLPILGIERGFQLINVACGGTLSPINSRIIHHGDGVHYHSLSNRRGTRMSELYGNRLIVESNHRYGLSDIAKDLKWSAKAADGLIEAVEHNTLPLLGVQFPVHHLPDDLSSQLMKAFLQLL